MDYNKNAKYPQALSFCIRISDKQEVGKKDVIFK